MYSSGSGDNACFSVTLNEIKIRLGNWKIQSIRLPWKDVGNYKWCGIQLPKVRVEIDGLNNNHIC